MNQQRQIVVWAVVMAGGLAAAMAAQTTPPAPKPVPGIIPSGFGESVDRDVALARAATARFRFADNALASSYEAAANCVANPPHGAMGYHFKKDALYDTTLNVEKPEILVYEKTSDGSFKLNGVEYIVPIAAWKSEEAPTIMGQKLKRADSLGIWYLHVWIWEPSPSGIFADWNPRVKC
jgi:hypothetical protein